LQAALQDATGSRLNIAYQEGGDGSVGWNALANAEPDGCTIANVVTPNISNLSLTAGEDVGFTAEDFEYIAFTEYSPNIIGVANNSEFQTIEDFIGAAEADPGSLTISGVGSNGELLVEEVTRATGIEVTFVPVSGGVGEIIPQVAGGHIDAAISGFSLLEGDQLRPLALSGTEPHEDFPDVPTFEEAGYTGVELVTSWGLILPPETPQEIVETWNAAVQEALQTEGVKSAYAETSFIVLEQDAAEARSYFEEQHEITREALGL
jgi:tripartite-type tricarboxylate transporter receptor subunit TctC